MYIEQIVLMDPEVYEVWSMSDNNFYVTDTIYKDLVEHYHLKENLYSLYTIENILCEDRDYAELHGISMRSEDDIVAGLAKLGMLSVNGLRSLGLRHYVDNTKSPSGEDVVSITIYYD